MVSNTEICCAHSQECRPGQLESLVAAPSTEGRAQGSGSGVGVQVRCQVRGRGRVRVRTIQAGNCVFNVRQDRVGLTDSMAQKD